MNSPHNCKYPSVYKVDQHLRSQDQLDFSSYDLDFQNSNIKISSTVNATLNMY